MLIHIHASGAADALSRSSTARASHACIENLLLAHFEGSHVVSLLPETIAELLEGRLAWSDRARRALQHIDENYSQIAGLRYDVAFSIDVGVGDEFDGRAHQVDTRRVIRAPLRAFDQTRKTSPCTLLGENRTDADLFVLLAEMLRAHRRWEAIDVVHDARGGGGDTTAIEFERTADRGSIVFAVGDTDQRYPQGGMGRTYRKLEAAAAGRPAYQRARALHVRTAEGLVPMAIYREVLTSPERVQAVDRLVTLLRSAPADVLRYAHIKGGIRRFEIENADLPGESEYWERIATHVGRDRCNQDSRLRCTKRQDCKCYVVDALGESALFDVVSWMKNQRSKRRLAARFPWNDDGELRAFADEVLSFGVALAPLQT